MSNNLSQLIIVIRGAGDLATGTACRLHRAGFFRLLMTEIESPLAVRRMVSFGEAVYEGSWTVESIHSAKIDNPAEAVKLWEEGIIPVLVDPRNNVKNVLRPDVIIDAIMAKRNMGTMITDAPLVIGLGPGFLAGEDVHYVVETHRGHDLGRVLSHGYASPDTGIPGEIGGQTGQRVIRAPADGIFQACLTIGSSVSVGSIVGLVSGQAVVAATTGIIRGLIRNGTTVTDGLKIGDVDPRNDLTLCFTISEKARAIGGAALEAILMRFNKPRGASRR